VTLRVIHGGVGAINESDVQLAMASNAIIVGFHVRPEGKARQLAEREGVDLRTHTVIYELIDEVTSALEGLLAPEQKEVYEGRAEAGSDGEGLSPDFRGTCRGRRNPAADAVPAREPFAQGQTRRASLDQVARAGEVQRLCGRGRRAGYVADDRARRRAARQR